MRDHYGQDKVPEKYDEKAWREDREFRKEYADKFYSMQQLMCNKGNERDQKAFEIVKRELCELSGLGKNVLGTDASVVAITGILHQEQEWIGRTVLRPNAYGSKVLSDSELKFGAPKGELFAVIKFVEKYPAFFRELSL